MSFEWTTQPLSVHSIATQYTLPVAIRSAPGFRGSNRPIILHSVFRNTFAYGRVLRANQTAAKSDNGSYRPVDSEIVAIPLKYSGYFECSPSHKHDKQSGVLSEKSIRSIVEQMQINHRPQAFYVASAMRVYTVEPNEESILNRIWHEVEPHQIILFDKLAHIEYTPTVDDDLLDTDYTFSWWNCFGKQILPRNESVLKCILTQQQVCYVPCSSTDELNLIPVGQRGSTNVNKLQMIQNLVEQFPMPINIKLVQLPGSYAYKGFTGHLQLLGTRSEEFAICASLSSTNIAVIPTNTPLKFLVSLLSSSSQIQQVLSSCHIFTHSFDMQIRRILKSSDRKPVTHRTRLRYPKIQAAIDDQFKRIKRSYSLGQKSTTNDDQTTSTTDEGYRSSSSAAKKRQQLRQQRSASVNPRDRSEKQISPTDDDIIYNSLVYPVRGKKKSSSPPPPTLPEKPPNYPYPSSSSAHENVSHLIEDLDSTNGEGAILMDPSNELFLALPSEVILHN